MTQNERLDFLIRYLLNEHREYRDIRMPDDLSEKRRLLRSLMNMRPPAPASEDFLKVQDAYLAERLAERGVTKLADLTPVRPDLYLWQGDITTLAADAIVNAANSQMLGCFVPCRYVLHTVGPIVGGLLTKKDKDLLASCYRSCLELAESNGLHSVAFCCISTGEFRFPNELAAKIAIQTVGEWQRQNPEKIKVIFNVFKDRDYEIYKRLLR